MTRSDDVRDAVLDAAKAGFRARGYLGTTMKGVAAAAGVAPDVLKRYYDNKDSLFAAAMRLPFDPATSVPALLAPGLDGMGERLVRFTLDTLGDEQARNDMIALFQAGSSTAKAAGSLKAFLESSVIDKLAGFIGVPDARMRVALISSYLVGVAASRYVLGTEPLASAPEELVVKLVAPTIQRLLDPSVPLPGTPTREDRAKADRIKADQARAARAAADKAAATAARKDAEDAASQRAAAEVADAPAATTRSTPADAAAKPKSATPKSTRPRTTRPTAGEGRDDASPPGR